VEETPKESGQGLPEEQPEEVAGEGESRRRESGEQGQDPPDEAAEGDDGKATGNPRSAG
jgi:hypothetical protein